MVTREFLLSNGFEFRHYEESDTYNNLTNWSPEGQYTRRLDSNRQISIGYSKLFKWDYEILNITSHIRFRADCQEAIAIDDLQKLSELAGINIEFKKPVFIDR